MNQQTQNISVMQHISKETPVFLPSGSPSVTLCCKAMGGWGWDGGAAKPPWDERGGVSCLVLPTLNFAP